MQDYSKCFPSAVNAKGRFENITLTRNSVTSIFSGSLIKVNKEVDDEKPEIHETK